MTDANVASRQQLEMVWPVQRIAPPVVEIDDAYRLRPGGPDDDEAWCALMARVGFAGFDAEALGRWTAMLVLDGWWVAEEVATGAVVASAMALDRPSQRHQAGGELGWVIADPDHAGHGLGAAVTTAATRMLLATDRRPVYLLTDDDRLPALRIYLRLGYVPLLHDADMPERWRAVCAALGWRYTPEEWVLALPAGDPGGV